ncbi:MAG TPA: sensor domain-containing diguanylate cyclase [Candidatus Dormibacteraeota bacterium]
MGAAVAIRVLVLPVTPATRATDIVMVALAACVGATLLRLPSRWEQHRQVISAVATVALAVLAAVGLHVAAPVLPDFAMVATGGFAAVLVGIETDDPPTLPLLAGAAVIVAFVVLWTTSAPMGQGIASLVVAVALLFGIRLLALGGAEHTRGQIDAETRRGLVYATLGRKLGVARDVPSVASAVLEACLATFPETSSGLVLMNDQTDGLLKSPGVYLSANGVSTGGPAYELAPGEGLGGAAFAAAHAELWPTTLSASMAQASLREANRVRLRRSKLGFIRSAIGAPLQVDGSTIGVILLTSERHEHAWTQSDLPLMTALADEAAKALERARRYEDEMGRALLDSVTGLPTRRHVLHVLDKEVARASRSEATLGVIIVDVDDFKLINDRWGHDTGNRVLESVANVLRSILRREDSAARSGADEFVCVLPGADRDQAHIIAGRIQQRFASETAIDHVAGRSGATASCGVAVYPADSQDVEGLIAAATAELATAKQSHHLTGHPRIRSKVKDSSGT